MYVSLLVDFSQNQNPKVFHYNVHINLLEHASEVYTPLWAIRMVLMADTDGLGKNSMKKSIPLKESRARHANAHLLEGESLSPSLSLMFSVSVCLSLSH